MSIIIKNLINSSINSDRRWKLLYYPIAETPVKFDNEIINLPFDFYIPVKNSLLQHSNVFDATHILSQFQCINLDGIILSNPIQQFAKASEISAQLHIPLFCIFNEPPIGLKKEVVFVEMEKVQRAAISICFSREIASTWFLSDYELINKIEEITEIIKQCRTYLRQ